MGRELKKGARTISNSAAPWVRAHVFLRGRTTCPGSRKPEQTQLLLYRFTCVCVCVVRIHVCRCVHFVQSYTMEEDGGHVSVWEDLNEPSLNNSIEQRGTGSLVLHRGALLHSAYT